MAYHQENEKDIVIDGWEKGISNNPFQGISDMRCVDPVTIPGEVSVAMSNENTYTPINVTGAVFTVDAGTDVISWAGTVTLTTTTVIRFTNSGGALPAGLSATKSYFIKTILSPTTFTVSEIGYTGALKDITDAGSGTNTFTVINMSKVSCLVKGTVSDTNFTYLAVDNNGRVWVYTNTGLYGNLPGWCYLNNLASELSTIGNNFITIWKDYLFLFNTSNVGYLSLADTLDNLTKKASWALTWQSGISVIGTGLGPKALTGQNDYVYFCNGSEIGSINEIPGQTFDPTDTGTYTYNATALSLLAGESATCLAELGTSLVIGGVNNYIYLWNRISSGYQTPLFLSENFTSSMVTVNTTTYIFAGNRGRIYMTNGSNISLFMDIPDYLSQTTNPNLNWIGATFNKNQLYFNFVTRNNAGTTIDGLTGLWSIDLDTKALRLESKASYGTYAGSIDAICQNTGFNKGITYDIGNGYGLFYAWTNGSTYGIDKGISAPYSGGQAYVTTDMIPVGQFLTKRTFETVEYKLTTPLVAGESVALSYSSNINATPVNIPLTQGNGTGDVSGIGQVNFENCQWIKLQITLTSTASSPSYVRLKEIRIR